MSRRDEGPVLILSKGARRMSRGVKSENRVIRTFLVVEILSGDRVHRQFPIWLLSRRDDGPVLQTFKGRAARCLAASTVGGKVPRTAPLPKRVLKACYLGNLSLDDEQLSKASRGQRVCFFGVLLQDYGLRVPGRPGLTKL